MTTENRAAEEHEVLVQRIVPEEVPEHHRQAKTHFEGKARKRQIAEELPGRHTFQETEQDRQGLTEHAFGRRIEDRQRPIDHTTFGHVTFGYSCVK
jgi:hypothetical protein